MKLEDLSKEALIDRVETLEKLLKEMAEAIELHEKHFGSNPILWLALQKFQDWKNETQTPSSPHGPTQENHK